MTDKSELLTATDETIDDAVKYADSMVLRGLLYQLTGAESIAATQATTAAIRDSGPDSASKDFALVQSKADVWNPSDLAMIQSKAAAFLKSYRDQGAPEIPCGPPERPPRSLSLVAGTDIPASEWEMWLEQLALDAWARGLVWQDPPPSEDLRKFVVAVIGAGMGGLDAAVQLKHAGIPHFVIEKNDEVGGTWYENQYPGARVDSPSRTYTHIYGVDFEYPNAFCPQSENLRYFKWVADHFDIRKDITFKTEVKSVIWDETAKLWEIKAEGPDGPRVWRANAVITSVGFLARPNMPSIEGMETFAGKAFHTARWPANLDLKGKRIAVIGTGATGYQLIPELAKLAGHTFVFQRTPNWCFDTKSYLDPFPAQVNWLDRNFPYIRNFIRLRLSWLAGPETFSPIMRIDPQFEDKHARSALNKKIREQQLAFIERKLAKRPDLIEKMTPVAPPYSARPIIIDTDYSISDAFLRDDVTLVTDPILKIKPNGIEVQGGGEYSVDIIVYATGFKANDFLWPMEVRGRGGKRVEELWGKDGARAYLGTMLPGFPNFFMLYGPNTNATGGLGIVDVEEMVTGFILGCVAHLAADDHRSVVEVTMDAYRRYNDELDRVEATQMYTDPRAQNYFKNEHGRSAGNLPFDIRKMWRWLRNPADARAASERQAAGETATDCAVVPQFGHDLVAR